MARSAHDDRVIDQFTRWAAPFADNPLHAEAEGMAHMLSAAAITARSAVLDVACGPGIVACAAAEGAAHVTGIDLTPAMIEQARARQQRLGLGNLGWRVGDATDLPFADASFDVVVTRYSFHHIPQPTLALAQMRRVVRPGGRIVVTDATPTPATQAAYDRMETLRDPSHASALTLDQLRQLGRAAGLTEASVYSYRLPALLSSIADPATMPALLAMFTADIDSGQDRIGVGARRMGDDIGFDFPISIVAWDA